MEATPVTDLVVQRNETDEAIKIARHLQGVADEPFMKFRWGNSPKRYPKTEDTKRMMDIYNKYYAEPHPGTTVKRTLSINCAPCIPKVVNYFLALKATQDGRA